MFLSHFSSEIETNISKTTYSRQKSISKTTHFYKEEFNKMSLKGMFNFIKIWFLSWWRSRQDIVSRTWETLSALNRLCSRFWHILHVIMLISLTHFTRKNFQVKHSYFLNSKLWFFVSINFSLNPIILDSFDE